MVRKKDENLKSFFFSFSSTLFRSSSRISTYMYSLLPLIRKDADACPPPLQFPCRRLHGAIKSAQPTTRSCILRRWRRFGGDTVIVSASGSLRFLDPFCDSFCDKDSKTMGGKKRTLRLIVRWHGYASPPPTSPVTCVPSLLLCCPPIGLNRMRVILVQPTVLIPRCSPNKTDHVCNLAPF